MHINITTSSCLIELKNTLPQTSWPQVIPALRQDTFIWNALQNLDFRELAISAFGSHPKKWTPARLALLSLKSDLNPESLYTTPLAELNPELRLQAIQTYEAHTSEAPPHNNAPCLWVVGTGTPRALSPDPNLGKNPTYTRLAHSLCLLVWFSRTACSFADWAAHTDYHPYHSEQPALARRTIQNVDIDFSIADDSQTFGLAARVGISSSRFIYPNCPKYMAIKLKVSKL